MRNWAHVEGMVQRAMEGGGHWKRRFINADSRRLPSLNNQPVLSKLSIFSIDEEVLRLVNNLFYYRLRTF